jgi:uncharacterized membrane protein YfcA
MVYFTAIGATGQQIRSTWALVSDIVFPSSFLANLVIGIYRTEFWPLYVSCPAIAIIGTQLGSHYHKRIDTETVVLILQALILLSTVPLTDPGFSDVFSIIMVLIYIVIVTAIGAAVLYFYSLKRKERQRYGGKDELSAGSIAGHENVELDVSRSNLCRAASDLYDSGDMSRREAAAFEDSNDLPTPTNSRLSTV